MNIVFIDPGHGGSDPGAVGNGIQEKDINLKVSLKIRDRLNQYKDVKVVMSRDTDKTMSLKERTDKANQSNADLLISVHVNASTSTSASGYETFVYTSVPSSTVAFQNVLHAEMTRLIGKSINDRGKKSANFHMLRESNMTAALTENLFISNKRDSEWLKKDEFLSLLALGHVNGVVKFLGLEKDEKKTITPSRTTVYRVQVGAFETEQYALDLQSQLIKDGYNPFISRSQE
jgi:N-acetylmuramoyl-L-alanine amidase